jgi:hypothetical protein
MAPNSAHPCSYSTIMIEQRDCRSKLRVGYDEFRSYESHCGDDIRHSWGNSIHVLGPMSEVENRPYSYGAVDLDPRPVQGLLCSLARRGLSTAQTRVPGCLTLRQPVVIMRVLALFDY